MSEKKIAELAANLDRKPPRSELGRLVLRSYDEGSGFLATTMDVEMARQLFAHAAQAEIEAHTEGAEEIQPQAVSL